MRRQPDYIQSRGLDADHSRAAASSRLRVNVEYINYDVNGNMKSKINFQNVFKAEFNDNVLTTKTFKIFVAHECTGLHFMAKR